MAEERVAVGFFFVFAQFCSRQMMEQRASTAGEEMMENASECRKITSHKPKLKFKMPSPTLLLVQYPSSLPDSSTIPPE